jgi:hypothetical protein
MATTNQVVLDGTKSYVVADGDISNVLSGGPYHLTRTTGVLTGFDDAWTLDVITDAAEILALNILYAMGTYALYPIYDAEEVKAGYLAVVDASDHLVKADSTTGALTLETITAEDYLGGIASYAGGGNIARDFEDPDDVATAISAAKDKVVFGE